MLRRRVVCTVNLIFLREIVAITVALPAECDQLDPVLSREDRAVQLAASEVEPDRRERADVQTGVSASGQLDVENDLDSVLVEIADDPIEIGAVAAFPVETTHRTFDAELER